MAQGHAPRIDALATTIPDGSMLALPPDQSRPSVALAEAPSGRVRDKARAA